MTDHWVLVPPEDFDRHGWTRAELRGVLLSAHLDHGGRRFPVAVYDPIRIIQDVEAVSGPFYEPNIVLVPEVTRESAEREIDRLAREEQLDWLLGLTAERETEWTLLVPEDFDWAEAGRHGVAPFQLGHGSRRFPLKFYDLARLAQVVGQGGDHDVRFHTKNLVVVREVTRESARRAVEVLGRDGRFRWLLDQ
jgi:hypothetical protein